MCFCVFMDQDRVEKKELGQYPAIITLRLVNNPYLQSARVCGSFCHLFLKNQTNRLAEKPTKIMNRLRSLLAAALTSDIPVTIISNTIIKNNWPLGLLPCQKQTDWEHEKKTQARLALWRSVEGSVKGWHFLSLQKTITPSHFRYHCSCIVNKTYMYIVSFPSGKWIVAA